MASVFSGDLASTIDKLRHAALKERATSSQAVIAVQRKSALRALLKSPRLFMCYCAFIRFFRENRTAFSKPSFVIIAQTPRKWRVNDVEAAIEIALLKEHQVKVLRHVEGRNKKGEWAIDPTDYLGLAKLLLLVPDGTEIHPDFEIAATSRARIEPGSARHFHALAKLFNCGEISSQTMKTICEEPSERIDALFRMGHPVEVAASRLKRETPKPPPLDVIPLHTNKGFGPASEWAKQLQRDLAQWKEGELPWSEVDKGILLYGPPGC